MVVKPSSQLHYHDIVARTLTMLIFHIFFLSLQGDLDLLSDNLFEELIRAAEPNPSLDTEAPDRSTTFHSDHDYLAHKSPSEHSDSGISVVSDDSRSMLRLSTSSDKNVTDDQLELYTSYGYSLTCNDPVEVASLYDIPSENDGSLAKAASSDYDHQNDDISDTFNEFSHMGKDDDISIDFGKNKYIVCL